MLNINNKSLDTFKAKLIDREISSNEVVTIDDWLDGSIQPTFIRQQEKFKEIKIKVLIEGTNEDDAYINFSRLAAELKYSTLKFDDVSLAFRATLNGMTKPNRLRPGVFEADFALKSGYGEGAEVVVNREAGESATFTIANAATAETPCVIELMPTLDIGQLTFEGMTDKPFTVKNIKNGQKVVIDGEANAILMNGKNSFNNFDGWSFPSLIPGANNIKVSSALGYTMSIKYKPRYI